MQLGMVGLGRMGANMVKRLVANGHECTVFDMSPKVVEEMAKEKGWQRCYNCKAMVELKEGCYHMTW